MSARRRSAHDDGRAQTRTGTGVGGSPILYRSKTDAAYVEIRRMILDGRLPPSLPLNQEQLAAELGISTTPLREALRRLESEGFVLMPAHRDVVVAPLDPTELHVLYDVRRELDAFAASLAASEHDAGDAERMTAACAELRAGRSDPILLNRAFHRAVYVASHNRVLIEILDMLWDRSDRYRRFTGSFASDPTVIEEHETMLQTILRRDAEGARRLMHAHVGNAAEMITDVLLQRDRLPAAASLASS
jgi:DNA-binding GntR family transcriptional regulator